MTDARLSVFVLGAGPVALALAGSLHVAGGEVVGLWARRSEAALAAERVSGIVSYSGSFPLSIRDAQVIILAVKDDAIALVASRLLEEGVLREQHQLLHCSGALAAHNALSTVAGVVQGIATFHPLRAFPKSATPATSLVGTIFGIEGNAAGVDAAVSLCKQLQGRPLRLHASQMAGYHAAATIVSNYLVALLDMSRALCQSQGIDEALALPAFCDLAVGAVENVRVNGLPQALTGPIRRGDVHTVTRHVQVLADTCSPLEPMYRLLGLYTTEIAIRCGDLIESDAERIRNALSEEASR